MRRAALGDQVAWARLVGRYSDLVWSVARTLDLSQDESRQAYETTWLRLTSSIERLPHPDEVAAWLIATARRETLRALLLGAGTGPGCSSRAGEQRPPAGRIRWRGAGAPKPPEAS